MSRNDRPRLRYFLAIDTTSRKFASAMCVFAFSGGVTSARQLQRDGVVLFDSMSLLPGLLADHNSRDD